MGVLFLRCPTTAREFSTGIHVEEDSFRRLPDTVTRAHCPHCGLTHSWWTREARLQDGIIPKRPAAPSVRRAVKRYRA
jgi:hypothetical protein